MSKVTENESSEVRFLEETLRKLQEKHASALSELESSRKEVAFLRNELRGFRARQLQRPGPNEARATLHVSLEARTETPRLPATLAARVLAFTEGMREPMEFQCVQRLPSALYLPEKEMAELAARTFDEAIDSVVRHTVAEIGKHTRLRAVGQVLDMTGKLPGRSK